MTAAGGVDPAALPAVVQTLARRLSDAGELVFLVGGSLRDLLRGETPHDYDLATSAEPAAVMRLFERVVPTGERFGTVTVLLDGEAIEVTTLRREGAYRDRRHPDNVVFTRQVREDLSRRDFTVNALALDLVGGQLHDPYDGRGDLERRVLRAVGDPVARFREDALRPLRACRFAAQLEFEIESATARAMGELAPSIVEISAERVRDEWLRLLARSRRPSLGFTWMLRSGLLAVLVPELCESAGVTQNRYHRFDVLTHALFACDLVPRSKPLVRLAALFHDLAKPRTRAVRTDGEATFYSHDALGAEMVERIMKRLRFSRADTRVVVGLVAHHMFQYAHSWSDAAVRRFIRRVGADQLESLFELRAADAGASGRDKGEGALLDELRRRVAQELERAAARPLTLAVDGEDIMRLLGCAPGPEVGRILARLEEIVVDDPERNTRPVLLALLNEWRGADNGLN